MNKCCEKCMENPIRGEGGCIYFHCPCHQNGGEEPNVNNFYGFEEIMNEWIKQGRDPMMVRGVQNFLTGIGGIKISQLLKEAEDEGFVNRGKLEAEIKTAMIEGYEEKIKEVRLNAFAEIEKFVEGLKKDKVQVPAACPDKMPGCLVYHFSYEETPEIKAYNEALSDISSFIKDKQKQND